MNRIVISLLLLCQACSAQIAPISSEAGGDRSLRTCAERDLAAYSPSQKEIEAHKRFDVPVVTRPFGVKRDDWELNLLVKIDEQGVPICYHVDQNQFDRKPTIDEARKAVLAKLHEWRFTPFAVDGKAAAAIVRVTVREQMAPERHVALPEAPISQVAITLERTGCYGMCPTYSVTAYGDGRAIYEGRGYVDVMGRHEYRIDPAKIAALIDSARRNDIWSMAGKYSYPATDNPTYFVRLKIGDQSKEIVDYIGEKVGMPAAITDFENEIDRSLESDGWINLDMSTVDRLAASGFRFDSKEGAELLGRSLANSDAHDDAAILKLISLGALPSVSARVHGYFGGADRSLLEIALNNRRQKVVESLVGAGALRTDGRIDQHKLDAAFRAAIEAGALLGVETVWDAGEGAHPALAYDEESEENGGKAQRTSVLLLLKHRYDQTSWEGQAIAEWLVAKGCDLKARAADGDTLLHRATEAGDLRFVRYLLAKNLDPSVQGTYGLPALGGANDEEIALALLHAGSEWRMDDEGRGFLRYARGNHWVRVLAWIDAHGGKEAVTATTGR